MEVHIAMEVHTPTEDCHHVRGCAPFRDLPLTPAQTRLACVRRREGLQRNVVRLGCIQLAEILLTIRQLPLLAEVDWLSDCLKILPVDSDESL